MRIHETKRRNSEEFLGTKNALAKIVRNRWPSMTIEHVRSIWELTEGEARGVVYAQASQRTVDKILKHPRGGWRIGLEVLEETIGHGLAHFINNEKARLAEEQRQAEEDARALDQMASRIPVLLGLGDRGGDRQSVRRRR